MAANIVIFFDKKSSLQILCDKYIFVKKFTCKKISKEINVWKIYVSKILFGKRNSFHWQFGQEIALAQIRKINLLLKKIPPKNLFHKYVHI